MALSQMQVFNDMIMPETLEALDVMVDAFNEASAGAIRLTNDGFAGDFLRESFFDSLHGAQRRVDRYGANDSVTPTALSEGLNTSVKVAGGFGPILMEPGQMSWLDRPTAAGIDAASQFFAEALVKDQLHTAIASLVAAIENQSDATLDISGGTDPAGALTYIAMNRSHALFGDKSGMLAAQVMNGAGYHRLVEENLKNAQRLFAAGGVRVIDILGQRFVVTDAPALVESGTPDLIKTIGLVPGAATVFDGGDIVSNIDTTNGNERIETTMQVDYSFSVRLKGYTWDESNGGRSPTDADLGTGSNWDLEVSTIKNSAGVILVADQAQ